MVRGQKLKDNESKPQMITSRIIILAAIVIAVTGAIGSIYHKGKVAGRNEIQLELNKQRATWEKEKLKLESDVAAQTGIYIAKVTELTDHWINKEQLFREEIDRLKANPDVIFVPKDTPCTIPKGFIEQHNRAAQGVQSGTPSSNFAEPAGKTLTEISNKVAKNYYQCNSIRAQLETLQNVVKEYQQRQKELVK